MPFAFGASLDPSFYALDIVARLGLRHPPVPDALILDYLGLTKRFYSGSRHFAVDEPESDEGTGSAALFDDRAYQRLEPTISRIRRPVDGALVGTTVWIDEEASTEKQRLATCHECGHGCLPWHTGLTYVRNGCLVDMPAKQSYEREAYTFAAHALMPLPFFQPDMQSMAFGFPAIDALARRYWTSVEATARQYVELSSERCALLVVEALPAGVWFSDGTRLKVRYGARSPGFSHFIRSGTHIPEAPPIARASGPTTRRLIVEDAPGWVVGLRPDRRLLLHCRPWGSEGDVLVLIQEPQGDQMKLL